MALFFDLDGTLVDTAFDFLHAIKELVNSEKMVVTIPSIDRVRTEINGGISALARLVFQDDLMQSRLLEHYEQCVGHHARLFPGMEQLLDTLDTQGVIWGVVTNKHARFSEPLLKKLALWNRAACVISGDTTQNPKPHPRHLLLACQKTQQHPLQSLYVGDGERDVLAARRAGMKVAVATFGYIPSLDEAHRWKADAYVDSPQAIWTWYQQWQSL